MGRRKLSGGLHAARDRKLSTPVIRCLQLELNVGGQPTFKLYHTQIDSKEGKVNSNQVGEKATERT